MTNSVCFAYGNSCIPVINIKLPLLLQKIRDNDSDNYIMALQELIKGASDNILILKDKVDEILTSLLKGLREDEDHRQLSKINNV